ncbi:MAG TPA: hypothetical protein VNH65_03230 [Candidatus Acidoferrum sp.]|nr:hypothetical protein [Candidatus Acidoferrum sp.]
MARFSPITDIFRSILPGFIAELKKIAAERPGEWTRHHSKILGILVAKRIPGASEIAEIRARTEAKKAETVADSTNNSVIIGKNGRISIKGNTITWKPLRAKSFVSRKRKCTQSSGDITKGDN